MVITAVVLAALSAAPDAGAAALDQVAGWQNATWGIDEAAVLKLYPTATRAKGGGLVMRTRVADLDAQVFFLFGSTGPASKPGALEAVSVRFDDVQKGFGGPDQVMDSLRATLTAKYGEPQHVGTALAIGWRGRRTLIQLGVQMPDLNAPRDPKRPGMLEIRYDDRAVVEASRPLKNDEL